MAADLLFSLPQNGSANLLFGETAAPPATNITISGAFPALTFHAVVCPPAPATIFGTFPALTASIEATYESRASRPVVGQAASEWQVADGEITGSEAAHQSAIRLQPSARSRWSPARGSPAGFESRLPGRLVRARTQFAERHANAIRAGAGTISAFQDALRDRRMVRQSTFAEALRTARTSRRAPHQDAIRTSRSARTARHAEALPLIAGWRWQYQPGAPLLKGWQADHENAMRPPAGQWTIPIVPPGPNLCYPPGGNLVFRWPVIGGNLLFICDNWAAPPSPNGETVVIPIRKAYIVVNDIALIRRENNLALPALALSINIDADSWTWGWQARLPTRYLDDVLPAAPGAPVGFEAVINGVHWYLLAEKVQRDRAFPQDRIAISGRGIAAELGAPYAIPTSRTNAVDRTAQQLMDDALTINGVGIGWALDWHLTDWLVPAGVWSHTGSHIEAVARIAEAAGGYVQAHRTSKILSIKPRYPVAPWAWNGVTPDFSLPAAVTTRESVAWIDNPAYNAVWISGESAGVLASVTRQGSAGDLAAPMVVDALNTHADASRQRGTSILGAAGRQQLLTLETPILSGVGIYPVGSFVQFADGANSRLGIVRSLAISAGKQTRQTIEVECHA